MLMMMLLMMMMQRLLQRLNASATASWLIQERRFLQLMTPGIPSTCSSCCGNADGRFDEILVMLLQQMMITMQPRIAAAHRCFR